MLAIVLAVGACISLHCRSLHGQVVQLPSVSTFGTTGAISVPDQGTAYLGGNRSSRSGVTSSGLGLPGSRATGSGIGGSSINVSATIIDLQAMDEALLNRPLQNLPARSYPAMQHGKAIVNTLSPKHYDRMAVRPPRITSTPNDWAIALGSPGDAVADISTTQNKVRYFMSQAADAQAAGHTAAAKVYYRMAWDRMTPDQQARYGKIQERNAEAARRGVTPEELEKLLAKEAAEKPTP